MGWFELATDVNTSQLIAQVLHALVSFCKGHPTGLSVF
jgi:hypothetical protein